MIIDKINVWLGVIAMLFAATYYLRLWTDLYNWANDIDPEPKPEPPPALPIGASLSGGRRRQ